MAVSMRSAVATPRAVAARTRRVACNASSSQKASLALTAAACAGCLLSANPAMASVALNVKNNSTISSPVHLEFSVKGLAVKPAAEGLQPGTGHFHLLIDESAPEEGVVIPFDSTHLHYGKGQTAADVELTPGKHTLTLQFADATHASYGPKEASTVTVTVN